MKVKINGQKMSASNVPASIREQVGYRPEGNYVITKAKTGGYRLYKWVYDRWMDASLKDDLSLEQHKCTDQRIVKEV